MAKDKKIGEWKNLMIKELTESLKKDNNIYVSDYIGMKADEINELRCRLERSSSKFMVVKNSIAKIALEEAGLKDLTRFVTGGTGMAFGGKNPIAVAKTLSKFGKDHEFLKVRGGLLDGVLMDAEKIRYLASLPGREDLVAKVIYSIKSPISGFAGVLGNLLKSLARAIQAIKDNKGG